MLRSHLSTIKKLVEEHKETLKDLSKISKEKLSEQRREAITAKDDWEKYSKEVREREAKRQEEIRVQNAEKRKRLKKEAELKRVQDEVNRKIELSSKPALNAKRSPMVGHAGMITGAKLSMPQAPKENIKAERSTATSTDDNPVVVGKESNNLATSRVTVPENMEALSMLNCPLPVVEPEKFAVSDSPSLNAGEKDYQKLTGHNHTESKRHTTTRHRNIPLQAEHEDDGALLNSSLDGEVNHSKLPQVTSPHDTLADKSESSGHKISFQVIPATSAGEKVKTEKGSSRWNKSKFSSLEPFRTGTRLSRKHTYDDLVNGDTRSSVPLINSTPSKSSASERTYMVAWKKPRIFQVLSSDIYLAANPKGYKQAMCSKDAAKWKAAIDD